MELSAMVSGHDCLAEHLHWIGCLQTSKCLFCKEDTIMNKSHLSECMIFSGENLTLCLEARGKNYANQLIAGAIG